MIKKEPTIIEFETEEEEQTFLNWAFGPSEPSEGVNNVKRLMQQARQIDQMNSHPSPVKAGVAHGPKLMRATAKARSKRHRFRKQLRG